MKEAIVSPEPPQTSLHAKTTRKIVRIVLPPSPPPDRSMNQADNDHSQTAPRRRSQRINGLASRVTDIVLPIDDVPRLKRLRSGSKWRQNDLMLLKVRFDPAEESELDILHIDHEWTYEQRESILLPWFAVISADFPWQKSMAWLWSLPRSR